MARRLKIPETEARDTLENIERDGPILEFPTEYNEQLMTWFAEQQGFSSEWVEGLVTIRPGTKARTQDFRNPALDDFLTRRRAELERWFPELYTRTFRTRQLEGVR